MYSVIHKLDEHYTIVIYYSNYVLHYTIDND
jgi:hypothetical protein